MVMQMQHVPEKVQHMTDVNWQQNNNKIWETDALICNQMWTLDASKTFLHLMFASTVHCCFDCILQQCNLSKCHGHWQHSTCRLLKKLIAQTTADKRCSVFHWECERECDIRSWPKNACRHGFNVVHKSSDTCQRKWWTIFCFSDAISVTSRWSNFCWFDLFQCQGVHMSLIKARSNECVISAWIAEQKCQLGMKPIWSGQATNDEMTNTKTLGWGSIWHCFPIHSIFEQL